MQAFCNTHSDFHMKKTAQNGSSKLLKNFKIFQNKNFQQFYANIMDFLNKLIFLFLINLHHLSIMKPEKMKSLSEVENEINRLKIPLSLLTLF